MSVIDTGIYAYFSNHGLSEARIALCRGHLIFGNISDASEYNTTIGGTAINLQDSDGSWMVMPGCKLELFVNKDYGGTKTTLDNTNGTTVRLYYASGTAREQTSSIKVYYKGVLGPNVSDTLVAYGTLGNTYT